MYQERHDREDFQFALLASRIPLVWAQHPPSAYDLAGFIAPARTSRKQTPEECEREMDRLWRALGGKEQAH